MANELLEDFRNVSRYVFADKILRRFPDRLLVWSVAHLLAFFLLIILLAGKNTKHATDILMNLWNWLQDDIRIILDPPPPPHFSFSFSFMLDRVGFWIALLGTFLCGIVAVPNLLLISIRSVKNHHIGLRRFRRMTGLVGFQVALLIVAVVLGALKVNFVPLFWQIHAVLLVGWSIIAFRVFYAMTLQAPLANILNSPPSEEIMREALAITHDVLAADTEADNAYIALRIQGKEWRARLAPSFGCFVSKTDKAPLFVKREEVKIETLGKDALAWSRQSVRFDIGLEHPLLWAGVKGRGTIAQKHLDILKKWKIEAPSV